MSLTCSHTADVGHPHELRSLTVLRGQHSVQRATHCVQLVLVAFLCAQGPV